MKTNFKLGAISLIISILAHQASAFTDKDSVPLDGDIGSCSLTGVFFPGSGTAAVYYISRQSGAMFMAGGSYFNRGVITLADSSWPLAPVTVQSLAACLAVDPAKITDLAQNGADKTFQSDEYMGFSFTLTEDTFSLAKGFHEYAIKSTAIGPVPTLSATPVSSASNKFTVTATFSEGVSGFDSSDVTVTNGTLQNFVVTSALVYNFDVVPTADGAVKVDIAPAAAKDTATDLVDSVAAEQLSLTGDVTAPTLSLDTKASIPVTGKFAVAATFSEAVIGFDARDVTVANGTVSNFVGSGTAYTFDVTPTADGDTTVDVAKDVATDTATNGNSAATQLKVAADVSKPSVVLTSSATSPHSGPFTVTATFSEVVTDFALADVSVVNGQASNLQTASGSVYSFTVTPDVDGNVTVNVAADVSTDPAGNANTAAAQLGFTSDSTGPSVLLSSDAAKLQSGPFTLTLTFSEEVTGLTAEDIVVGNGTKGTLVGSGTTYTMEIRPTADGEVTVDLAAGVATDAAANDNTVATQLGVMTDNSAPTVAITGPTGVVTGDFAATFTFSEPVTGFTKDDVTLTNGVAGSLTGSGSVYTLLITPVLGTTVQIEVAAAKAADDAGNANTASNTLQISAGSPASEFAAREGDIRRVIVDDATRSLRGTIGANQHMARDARGRFIDDQLGAGQEDVPLGFDGNLDANGVTVSSMGTFYGQEILGNGQRRLVFGDFDVQRDGATGSSTATLTGRVAWEQMVGQKTLLGYFVGGEVASSTIAGAFEGNQGRLGLAVGGYAVHELGENTYLDGFLTLGAGRNNLEIADAVLALDSDYATKSVTFGGALSSVIEKAGYEIWPELSASYGRTWIGDVGFTGSAYGLVDNMLSLDAGSVTLANIMFRPEFRVPLDGLSAADSLQLFTFAPRLICEHIKATVTEENCGGGAEIGFTGQSADGFSTYVAKIVADRLGNRTNTGLQLNLEHKF